MNATNAAKELRKRIRDLHAMIGHDGSEAVSARRHLIAVLQDKSKTWTLLTLTIQVALERLPQLPADEQDIWASLAQVPDDVAALVTAHEQVGAAAADDGAAAEAIKQIKTLLGRHGLGWGDLTNLLEKSMEATEEWQPNLFDSICDLMRDYVVFKNDPHDVVTSALWILHTYVYDRFQYTPRLGTFSYDPQSGKSVLVTHVMGELTRKPKKLIADKGIAPSLYWLIHNEHPTTLLDEAQNTEITDTLKSIVNGGFDKAIGGIIRRTKNGTVTYNCFAPLAFCWNKKSALSTLPLDTLSRCIVLDFEPGPRTNKRFDLSNTKQMQEFAELPQRIEQWAMSVVLDNGTALQECIEQGASVLAIDPVMPSPYDEKQRRIADCWRVLLSIADAFDRGALARAAMIELSKRRMDESIRVRLLRDIRTVFNLIGIDYIKSEELLLRLQALEECSLDNSELWNHWTGIDSKRPPHALTKNEMGALLRTFNIRPRSVRYGPGESQTLHGYDRRWFESLWERHCPEDDSAGQKIKYLRVAK